MLTSNFIAQLRRKYADNPKLAQVIRTADGASTAFNVGRNRIPVVENSYSVYFGTSAKAETSDYLLDKDTGDIQTVLAQSNGLAIKVNFKHANMRDAAWVEAINYGIDALNGRGFFRQIARSPSGLVITPNTMRYSAPSGCIDLYEILQPGYTTTNQPLAFVSGGVVKLQGNWSYQSDANKVVLGFRPTTTLSATISYLRNLQKFTATSATLDVRNEWLSLLDLKAGAYYFRFMASKIAQEGNASIKEGHFSFSSLRAQATDLENIFEVEAKRVKPTRPAKDIQFNIAGAGIG